MCARMWTCATRLLALVCALLWLGLPACGYDQEEIAYYKSQVRDGRILGDWLTCDKATGQPDGEYTYRYLANGEFWKLNDKPPSPPRYFYTVDDRELRSLSPGIRFYSAASHYRSLYRFSPDLDTLYLYNPDDPQNPGPVRVLKRKM